VSGANPETVKAVQKWLNSHENAGLTVTGVYDQPTRFAVMLFQEKHSTDTLGSWGIEKATGNIWLTTANVMLIVAGCGGYDLSGVNLFPFSN
jgi:peptidoglycan hydrolase-like protein with peptidoglycan-binding domain